MFPNIYLLAFSLNGSCIQFIAVMCAFHFYLMVAATSAPLTGSSVVGVIDGKFDNGYLVTVTIGSEQLKGVLYQAPQNPADEIQPSQSVVSNVNENATTSTGVLRRRRRKKCEMKKRDPAHPKPNRSGYNFFFAEQHARLKPLYPGKDRDISRMIGESWNKLNESDRAVSTQDDNYFESIRIVTCRIVLLFTFSLAGVQVYQEKAVRDKERYRLEMEEYRERLRTGQITSDVLPINQQPLESDVHVMEMDEKIETEGGDSPKTLENDLSSGKSDKSNFEDNTTADKDIDMEKNLGVEIEAESVGMETSAEENRRVVKNGQEGEECLKDGQMESQKEPLPSEGKESAPPEEEESVAKKARIEKESGVPIEEQVPGELKDSVPCEDK